LDLLVYGAKAGIKKLEKAEKYEVPTQSWEEFIKAETNSNFARYI